MLAYRGKRRQLVRILRQTSTGAVAQYEPVEEPGNRYMPLIENGKNVERFELVEERQLDIF
ncbi:hypothetical protein, partial [Desulfofalx alkaliphila]|uniref:hypothetical protein n=1 Tax=Desulfofalx alkaliphila TaxID=105483 RepID=UPI0005597855